MIESIEFKLMSPQMIKKIAAVEINRDELYDNDGFPVEGGVMDPKLGVIDPGLKCRTCGLSAGACPGHFGYIQLTKPVIHVLYGKVIYKLLKSTCKSCGRVIAKKTTIATKCPYCSTEQGNLKFEKPYSYIEDGKFLTPIEIRERLERIPDSDLPELEFFGGRPEWLVLTLLPVPPVVTRPSITLETGERSEDDLTHKLVDVVRINQRLRENIDIGAPEFILEDLWELLQYHVATFFNNELAGIPAARHRSGRPLKTLADRLKSKEGRFRQNLSGKRVNFSARTVISPDPGISINEVGVPLEVAKELTIPITVQKENLEQVKNLIRNFPNWPTGNYIIRPDGRRKKITLENKDEILEEISPGYLFERQLINGDIVLFNRQPSLHRMSIMAHRVRIHPWKTLTLNVAVATPYNADFDGDEMNLHVPQSVEARAESKLLLSVENHIRSPRFGGPIIGSKQDSISGCYQLTKKGNEFTREEALSLLAPLNADIDKLPNKKKITGKEIFSVLLPKGLNIEFKGKTCINCENCKKANCPYDAYVEIKNGKLEAGKIDAKSIASEKGKLIDIIEKEYGAEEVKNFIDRVSMLGVNYVTMKGFTIGLDDIEISDEIKEKARKIIEKSKADVKNLIDSYNSKSLETLPGRTPEESLEDYILGTLSNAVEEIGKLATKSLSENDATIMAKSGAKGSLLHIVQMAAILGQERAQGERIKRGYYNRTLSHFKPGDLSGESHGLVENCFKTGLNPYEFFFELLSGRLGLMDKSLRTRHSGYLERRLMNALQDLKIEYDNTVRDGRGVIIQFVPGEDGIDPSKSDFGTFDIESIIQSVVK